MHRFSVYPGGTTHPSWSNFYNCCILEEYYRQDRLGGFETIVNNCLEKYNGIYIIDPSSCHNDTIEFNSDEDATAFVLKWS